MRPRTLTELGCQKPQYRMCIPLSGSSFAWGSRSLLLSGPVAVSDAAFVDEGTTGDVSVRPGFLHLAWCPVCSCHMPWHDTPTWTDIAWSSLMILPPRSVPGAGFWGGRCRTHSSQGPSDYAPSSAGTYPVVTISPETTNPPGRISLAAECGEPMSSQPTRVRNVDDPFATTSLQSVEKNTLPSTRPARRNVGLQLSAREPAETEVVGEPGSDEHGGRTTEEDQPSG